MKDDDLDLSRARWALGMIGSDELPRIALRALEDGVASSAMERLAGLTVVEHDEAPELFERALQELGRRRLSKAEALYELARYAAERIVRQEIGPYDGAKLIWEATLQSGVDHQHTLDPFIYAASEYEDRPEDRGHFSEAIMREARELASRPTPFPWTREP